MGLKHQVLIVFSGCLFLLMLGLPVHALVRMDKQSVELALKYGMQNQNMGIRNLLGNNWIEAPGGTLINIYTPFMVIASRCRHAGLPENPTPEEIKKAKTKYARLISTLTDPNHPLTIKFSVSLYGDQPNFANFYRVRIEGIGRGRRFVFKPTREIRQQTAEQEPDVLVHPYAAINAYYFRFEDLFILEDYQFILVNTATGEETVLTIRNDKIY